MPGRKQETNLFKIIAVIVIVGGAVLGVMWAANFFQDYVDKGVEAAAVENLDRARILAEEGNTVEASKLLRPILTRVNNPNISPKALLLQAELDRRAGDMDAALEHLQSAAENYEGSPDTALASLTYAAALDEAGRADDAVAVYMRVAETAPPAVRAPAVVALGRHKERLGDIESAYNLYSQAEEDAEWGSDSWYAAARGYGKINVARILSAGPTPDSKVYRVSTGDTLTTIGMKLNTTQGLLMRANGMDNPNRLRLNQNLKYTPKDFELVIERSTLRLFLLDKNGIFNVYQVGLGKPGNDTTLGKYRIGNKEKNPTWYKPGFGPIAPNAPGNELGTRWMPMIPEEEGLPNDLGIHGTIAPDTVGLYSSMGCPRLLNEEVEELYDLIVRSTPVTVVDRYTPDQRV